MESAINPIEETSDSSLQALPEPVEGRSDESCALPEIPAPAAIWNVSKETRLERRVVNLWRLTSLLNVTVAFAVITVIGVTAMSDSGFLRIGLIGAAVLYPLTLGIGYWHAGHLFTSWSYRLDDRILATQRGVVFRVNQYVPLPRLQHVDIHRGPLERSMGLATLIVYTAGTQYASIVIPGLAAQTAVQLRDRLVELGVNRDA